MANLHHQKQIWMQPFMGGQIDSGEQSEGTERKLWESTIYFLFHEMYYGNENYQSGDQGKKF